MLCCLTCHEGGRTFDRWPQSQATGSRTVRLCIAASLHYISFTAARPSRVRRPVPLVRIDVRSASCGPNAAPCIRRLKETSFVRFNSTCPIAYRYVHIRTYTLRVSARCVVYRTARLIPLETQELTAPLSRARFFDSGRALTVTCSTRSIRFATVISWEDCFNRLLQLRRFIVADKMITVYTEQDVPKNYMARQYSGSSNGYQYQQQHQQQYVYNGGMIPIQQQYVYDSQRVPVQKQTSSSGCSKCFSDFVAHSFGIIPLRQLISQIYICSIQKVWEYYMRMMFILKFNVKVSTRNYKRMIFIEF